MRAVQVVLVALAIVVLTAGAIVLQTEQAFASRYCQSYMCAWPCDCDAMCYNPANDRWEYVFGPLFPCWCGDQNMPHYCIW